MTTTEARANRRKTLAAQKRQEAAVLAAYREAKAEGWNIHERLAAVRLGEQKALPRGWAARSPGEAYCPVRRTGDCITPTRYDYWLPDGTTAKDVGHGCELVHVIENASGWPIAILLRDSDRWQVCAVGGCQAHVAFVSITVTKGDVSALLALRRTS